MRAPYLDFVIGYSNAEKLHMYFPLTNFPSINYRHLLHTSMYIRTELCVLWFSVAHDLAVLFHLAKFGSCKSRVRNTKVIRIYKVGGMCQS
jgi:hypothetical protein